MASISVIVPVYRVEAYLHRCVESILRQSFRDLELILVDDGSPDNCGALCDGYARLDSRVRVIHQENGGLSAARNAGIDWVFAHSQSQWLAFVDSDDWVAEDFLERLYRAAEQTGCRLSVCGFRRTEGQALPEQPAEEPRKMEAEEYYCGGEIHGGVTAVAWNKLYHRSLFESLRYPVGKLHEDEFTTYRAVYAAGEAAVLRAELYAYYQNPQGIMLSKWNPRRMDLLEAFSCQIAFARERRLEGLLKKAVKQNILFAYGQLETVKRQADVRHCAPILKKKLRQALKLGRVYKVFPLGWDTLWAYEQAYPAKPLWWLAGRIKDKLKK